MQCIGCWFEQSRESLAFPPVVHRTEPVSPRLAEGDRGRDHGGHGNKGPKVTSIQEMEQSGSSGSPKVVASGIIVKRTRPPAQYAVEID